MKLKLCRKLSFYGSLFLFIFYLTPGALCFSSGIHDTITDQALAQTGFSETARKMIKEESKKVDSSETGFIVTANELYRPEHHFDHIPGVTHLASFQNGAAYLRQKKAEIIGALREGNVPVAKRALKDLGRAFHAIQDFYSHSNYVFLRRVEQKAIRMAFDEPNQDLPPGLKLTGFDPNTQNPVTALYPAGDQYPHGIFKYNKDFGWGKDGALAKQAAVEHTMKFLDQIKGAAGEENWSHFLSAR